MLPSKQDHKYEVKQNLPHSNTWYVKELWEDGVVRSPFKTREEAIELEQRARDYYPDLTLV